MKIKTLQIQSKANSQPEDMQVEEIGTEYNDEPKNEATKENNVP